MKLVSLDLDGTLIQPAIFNAVADALGFGAPLAWSYREYLAGRMTIPEAFEHDYRFLVGRRVDEMRRALDASAAWTPGIARAIARFHEAGLRVIVTTDQPRFLAEAARRFGVDDFVCSEAEVVEGVVTGNVESKFEKWPNLARYLASSGVAPAEVAHVGNGTNDIPVFERVGGSIAVNYEKDAVAKAARHAIPRVLDFGEVADVLLS